jgi:hydrogenase-4 membrane subunit HyfE
MVGLATKSFSEQLNLKLGLRVFKLNLETPLLKNLTTFALSRFFQGLFCNLSNFVEISENSLGAFLLF